MKLVGSQGCANPLQPVTTESEVARVLTSALDALSLDFEPGSAALDRLSRLSVAVSSWGERINLTGHRDAAAVVTRLTVPAIALAKALPPWTELVDVGSGAGFPGLPIAILHPDRAVVLIEPRLKRQHFLRKMVRDLELQNVETIRDRIEDLVPRPMDIALAQAMGPGPRVAELLSAWVKPGGWIIIPSGPSPRRFTAPDGFGEPTPVRFREAPARIASLQLLQRL